MALVPTRSQPVGGSRAFLCDLGQAATDGAAWIDGANVAADVARAGGPGLLFDQEHGLLALAPVYVLAATGLWQMWRAGDRCGDWRSRLLYLRRLAGTVGAFGIWWGGVATGPPIVSGLLLFMRRSQWRFGARLPRRCAARSICCCDAHRNRSRSPSGKTSCCSTTRATARRRCWSSGRRAGSGRWPRPSSASRGRSGGSVPHGGRQWPRSRVALTRVRASGPGWSAFIAAATLAVSLIVIAMTMPLLPVAKPMPRVDLSARSRLAALDGFDARVGPRRCARPVTPRRNGGGGAATDAWRQSRTTSDRQPMRGFTTAFTLPAGTYRIDVAFNASAAGQGGRCRCRWAAPARRSNRGTSRRSQDKSGAPRCGCP